MAASSSITRMQPERPSSFIIVRWPATPLSAIWCYHPLAVLYTMVEGGAPAYSATIANWRGAAARARSPSNIPPCQLRDPAMDLATDEVYDAATPGGMRRRAE